MADLIDVFVHSPELYYNQKIQTTQTHTHSVVMSRAWLCAAVVAAVISSVAGSAEPLHSHGSAAAIVWSVAKT